MKLEQIVAELQPGEVIRTTKHGVFKVAKSKAWGTYFSPVDDPEGVEVPKKVVEGFVLNENFPKIPAELWSPYIALCFHMCPANAKKLSRFQHDEQYEVQICLCRDMETLSKWKIVVPRQEVSGASVTADLTSNVDILTGETYDQFPPPGWVHAGTSHSHNTMDAFFSSIDDKSELSIPGLHIVIGNIDHDKMTYTHRSSIVMQKKRRIIRLEDVVDVTPVNLPFHENVLDFVNVVVYANRNRRKFKFPGDEDESSIPVNQVVTDSDDFVFEEMRSTYYEPLELFDKDGNPTNFFNGLDATNSDLFDDIFLDEDGDRLPLWLQKEQIMKKMHGDA